MENKNNFEVGWMKEKFQIISLNESICEFDWTIEPGGSVPSHIHRYSDEYFQVYYGELTVQLNGQTKILKTGESLVIPKLTTHAVSNRSKDKIICRVSFKPPADQGKFFQILKYLKTRNPNDKNPLFKALYISKKMGFKEFSSLQGGMGVMMGFLMGSLKLLAPFNGYNKLAKDFAVYQEKYSI